MPDPTPARQARRWPLVIVLVGVFAAGIWYFGFREGPPPANPRGPNPAWAGSGGAQVVPVKVVVAERQALPVHLKAIGTVTPLNAVTVRSRVDGELLKIHFAEGQQVSEGDLLAEIEAEPYRILLAQAEGQLEQSAAQLDVARSDLERLRPLTERNLVTAQQFEVQQALVREREGVLAANRARVADARLQLAYTRIQAPISGRLGLRQVDAGNLIRAGDANGIAVIAQTRPISVVFTIPEIDLLKVLEPVRRGERLVVEAWDRSEQVRLAEGVLQTVDNQIDLATGTLKLKAQFANADDRLFPNQFVNVRLRVQTLEDAIVIPTAAVQFGSRGTYVFVVGPENTVTARDIVLGPAEGTNQAVASGLAAGDKVVLEGLDRLREGRKVLLVDDDQPLVAPGS
jgi:multidrug efflux system membrane fusion protein